MTLVAPLKILKASAGSGKTFSLTLHYIALLLTNENSYREILAVTFTNKATAEMKERILSVLQGLAQGDPSDKIQNFGKLLLEQNPAWSPTLIQEKAHRVYRKILHDYSHFTISTIDGFSQKVIRSFTYELNLDAAYKIEMNTSKVKAELTTMLNELLDERPDLLDWVLAFAEKKINNNENWNYRNQLSQLAGLIFTENFQEFDGALAAADANQVFNLLDKEIVDKTTAFQNALSELINEFKIAVEKCGATPEDLKQGKKNKLFSASSVKSQVSKLSVSEIQKNVFDKFLVLLHNEDVFCSKHKETRHDLIAYFEPILSRFQKMHAIFPTYIAYQAVQSNLYYLRLLKEMSNLLGAWRKKNTAQLISDSQILLNKLGLDAHNDPTFIWEKIGNRYNYFLFDEFQDTSRIQWKNYSPLLINALGNAEGKQHEHLIVGDVKQSIYRWRNGDWRILLQQVETQIAQNFHLSEADKPRFIEQGVLDTNFRSLPNIIRFNNYLFQNMPTHLQNVLNDVAQSELSDEGLRWWHQAQNDSMITRAYAQSTQEIPTSKLAEASQQGSIEIDYLPISNSRSRAKEAQELAAEKLCLKIGEWLSTGRYEAKQIGILVRSNKQATLIIQRLMEYKLLTGLQFDVISGDALALASNDAVQLLVETLKAFVYNSDKHVIHHARIAYLYQIIQAQQSFDSSAWLLFKENNISKFEGILPDRLLAEWNTWQKLPLIHVVEKLIEIYDFTSQNNIHLAYILAFKDIVGNFTVNGERGINQFLEFWEEENDKLMLPSSGKVNAIEVTTVHKSKGLAYDVVMIPFCSWKLDEMKPVGFIKRDFWITTRGSVFQDLGKIPIKYEPSLSQSIFYPQYFEEMLFNYMDSLNTLYVATTRAIEHLYITAPSFIEKEDKKLGKFLDIKNEYISDAMYQVLDHQNSPFPLEAGKLLQDHPLSKGPKSSQEDSQHIALAQYPISLAMERALDKNSKRTINAIMMMEKASQYGILAHEVMAAASKESDIQRILAHYLEEGILALENKAILEKEIYQIWHHPQINQWLTGGYKIWNEAAIITSDGRTLRPDKVFSKADETIILDFKFTGDNYIEHKTQVDQYMKAIQNLGYQQVKGYLFYAKANELVEIK